MHSDTESKVEDDKMSRSVHSKQIDWIELQKKLALPVFKTHNKAYKAQTTVW